MSRNRFLLIMRCLHFTSEEESEDPLFKVRSIIDYFNNKMTECYYPGKELSLDESMVLWRGRLAFRQFIKNKRHKYGIKLYMLTEPDGLILKFRVYAGGKDIEVTGKGHAEKVVMELLQGKLNNGHELYMDNYYNSFSLAKKLLENNTYCTGTLRKDLKENPREVMKKKLGRGKIAQCFGKEFMLACGKTNVLCHILLPNMKIEWFQSQIDVARLLKSRMPYPSIMNICQE
ncbi:hypothetical protein PYW07_006641 [Mythimna separata]|uniref:PiggyBac transposable element-derived protein domain-containing protein n=1 Tax=Mythimna separata TaxID=271217 RepID=A0AAD8DWS9_MYTSE|nr:hypothetical protein PYW07_006641 [Mythimna separata]